VFRADIVMIDNALVGREFVHFKGGRYRLEGFAKYTETREEMVVYRALYGEGGLWVRPAAMFFEHVEKPGYSGPRFKLVDVEHVSGRNAPPDSLPSAVAV